MTSRLRWQFLGRLHEEGWSPGWKAIAPPTTGLRAEPNGRPRGCSRPPVLREAHRHAGLVLIDPVHDVSEAGWPHARPDPGSDSPACGPVSRRAAEHKAASGIEARSELHERNPVELRGAVPGSRERCSDRYEIAGAPVGPLRGPRAARRAQPGLRPPRDVVHRTDRHAPTLTVHLWDSSDRLSRRRPRRLVSSPPGTMFLVHEGSRGPPTSRDRGPLTSSTPSRASRGIGCRRRGPPTGTAPLQSGRFSPGRFGTRGPQGPRRPSGPRPRGAPGRKTRIGQVDRSSFDSWAPRSCTR